MGWQPRGTHNETAPDEKLSIGVSAIPMTRRGLREDETKWRIGLPGACEYWWPEWPSRDLAANEIARALISMMARSMTRSNVRPDTLMQDSHPPDRRDPLATRGRTIHSGSGHESGVSYFAQIPDGQRSKRMINRLGDQAIGHGSHAQSAGHRSHHKTSVNQHPVKGSVQ